ncbi:MAG: shikimate kinase [Wenzhouxiangellaceae bacterium]|nr:shikimate kinase [Wenzhouxiangellaceae bacterium]
MNNIFLVGPMGSGKTTLGRRVAPALGLDFIDLDEELERRCGVEVAVIFDIEGEAGFRERESRLLEEIAAGDGRVVATGGGVVLSEANRAVLRNGGRVVWLDASVAQQLRRLERDKRRPLLSAPDRRQRLERMAEQRNPLYRSVADVVFESKNLPLPQMARRLEQAIRERLDTQEDRTCPSSN